MWPFKDPPLMDTSDTIFLTEDGSINYPLEEEDPVRYKESIEKIFDLLRMWMSQDIAFASSRGLQVSDTLVYQLAMLDLKLLAYPTYLSMLDNIMDDTSSNEKSGSRLMDTIVRICVQVPMSDQRVITGKFLYGNLYGIPREINGMELPSKSHWAATLLKYPWVVYLPFLQELYDDDDIVAKITDLQKAKTQLNTTTQVVNTPIGSATTTS